MGKISRAKQKIRVAVEDFKRRHGKGVFGRQTAKMRGEGAVTARVFRADTGTWEDLGVVATTGDK